MPTGRKVECRARDGSRRDAVQPCPVRFDEGPGTMYVQPRTSVSRDRGGDVDRDRTRRQEPPKPGSGPMAEKSSGPTSQNRREAPAAGRQISMSDRIDAVVDAMEAAAT